MKKTTLLSLAALSAFVCSTACEAATPGELVIEPATLRCAGFHWEITDDGSGSASAAVEFRKAGDAEWRTGLHCVGE